MELLWYQFIHLDGTVEIIPERSISRVTQTNSDVNVHLSDGTTLSFIGTLEGLFGSIAAQMAALNIVSHTITYQEVAS